MVQEASLTMITSGRLSITAPDPPRRRLGSRELRRVSQDLKKTSSHPILRGFCGDLSDSDITSLAVGSLAHRNEEGADEAQGPVL